MSVKLYTRLAQSTDSSPFARSIALLDDTMSIVKITPTSPSSYTYFLPSHLNRACLLPSPNYASSLIVISIFRFGANSFLTSNSPKPKLLHLTVPACAPRFVQDLRILCLWLATFAHPLPRCGAIPLSTSHRTICLSSPYRTIVVTLAVSYNRIPSAWPTPLPRRLPLTSLHCPLLR